MKQSNQIIYTGDLDELYDLLNENGEIDNDKIYDWLSKSKNISCDSDVRIKINQVIRKNKINKINNK